MGSKHEIKHRLALRSDRLGYWRIQKNARGIFYCIGEEGASTRRYTMAQGKTSTLEEKADNRHSSDTERATETYSRAIRFRFIPWYLRDTFVIFWCTAAFILLLALMIVSFLPSTAIRKGFLPLVSPLPNSQGYSPADFVYSFIPSMLGMLLYLLFQPLDLALRRLQPWAELGNPQGATANHSLLLDYTAALPISCTLNALSSGHYRIALTSILSLFFILLPVLAGGLLFPLTAPDGGVRMLPNLTAFYLILVLLILYLTALLLLLPGRAQMHLPHDVSCLAEIFSFVHNSGMLDDAAFRAPRTKADLVTRLMAVSAYDMEKWYAFGIYRGRNGKECLGIERLGRRGQDDVLVLSSK